MSISIRNKNNDWGYSSPLLEEAIKMRIAERNYLNPAISEFSYSSKDEKRAIKLLDMIFEALPTEKQNEIKGLIQRGLIEEGIAMTINAYPV